MPTRPDENIPAELSEEIATSSKRAIWQEFTNDHELLRAHNVKPNELEALSRVAMLGSVQSKDDLIFILSAIRRPGRR